MRGVNIIFGVGVFFAIWAETAEARRFFGFFGRRPCVSCQPRSSQRFNNVNLNSVGACRKLNQVDEATNLRECVDSSGRRSLVQKVTVPLDALGKFYFSREPNLELVRNFDGSVTFIRRLFIRDGVLTDRNRVPMDRYASGQRVINDLKTVYQDTFANFRNGSRSQRLVSDFMRVNGGVLSNGVYAIDLDATPLPPEFDKLPQPQRRQIALRALNFMLNTVNTNCDVRFADSQIQADGTVNVDFFGPAGNNSTKSLAQCLGPGERAYFEGADATFACTGKIRLGNLVAKLMNPEVYYDLMNAPQSRQEFVDIVEIRDGIDGSRANKIFISTPLGGRKNREGKIIEQEPQPTSGKQRILEVQRKRDGAAPGKNCFRSFDFDVKKAGAEADARNVFQKGVNVNHDAEEWLCIGQNGFMQGYIFDQKGKRLDEAPTSIAHGGIVYDTAIASVISCLDCHAGGFNGAGPGSPFEKEGYTDHFNPALRAQYQADTSGRIGREFKETFDTYFTSLSEYGKFATESTTDFMEAIDSHNAKVVYPNDAKENAGKAFPILPGVLAAFNRPLVNEDVTRENSVLRGLASLQGDEVTRDVYESQLRNRCEANVRAGGGIASQVNGRRRGIADDQVIHDNQRRNPGRSCGNGRRCDVE